MHKRILIAVNDSILSKRAVKYAIKIEAVIKDLHYTLLNIHPKVSEFLFEDSKTHSRARSALSLIKTKNEENSLKILNIHKTQMIRSGIDKNLVEIVTQPVNGGTAKTILDYGKTHRFKAIIMGNRRISRLTESLTGSITNNVLEHAEKIPVWAVGGEINNPGSIMVAVDGSESALRAVDYVATVFEGNNDVQITLLHVTPKLRDVCAVDFMEEVDEVTEVITLGDKKCVENFYLHAWQRFKRAGLSYNQLSILEVESTIQLGRIIVKEAKKGKFGTLVIGRRGINDSFFIGSTSRDVLINAPDCAVWLVP